MDTCLQGHKLVWAKSSQPGIPAYFCDVCKESGFPAILGRWSCRTCDWDICKQCKPDLPNLNICENGHELKWMAFPKDMYACDMCRSTPAEGTGKWNCAECNYDLCISCKSPPEKLKQYCENDHKLLWSSFDGKFNCNYCKNLSSENRWACSECNWYVCKFCRDPPQPSIMNCPNDHTLVFGYPVDQTSSEEFYSCDFCLIRGFKQKTLPRWNCSSCNYDVCISCRPAPSQVKESKAENEKKSPEQEIKEINIEISDIKIHETPDFLIFLNACKICLQDKESFMIIPCGHPKFCADCLSKITVCPDCGAEITGKLKLFTAI